MSLDLDERRRAMLEEIGVRVFAPPADAPPVTARPEVAAAAPRSVPLVARMAPIAPASPAVLPAATAVLERADRPAGVDRMDWDALAQAVAGCQACRLCEGRRNTVFGVGPPRADWLVVGEAPGENEDLKGEPFVGQAGKLLDNMLAALGLDRRQHVYIANVLKCRPPGNRNPGPDEVAQCEPFLRRQVELLQPRMILAMGRFAVQTLLQSSEPIGKLRGRAHAYNGVPVVVTYHPAYLLRNLPDKAKAWADLCMAQALVRANAGA